MLETKERPILDRFHANAHNYCLSQVKKEFLGFSCSSSINECLHNRLKEVVPSRKDYSITVKLVLEYLEVLGSKADST